jgi:outer membrane receptor protein involved in Fe transport
MDGTTGTTVTLTRVAGGTQRSYGVFVQDIFTPTPRWTITGSARVDHWRNYDAHNLEHNQPSGSATTMNVDNFPDKEYTVGSPRIAALYRATDRVHIWGDFSGGFRAPTLNELYRLFRVGARLTLANENLTPERLWGGEVGASVALPGNTIARSTWFDNRMKDPVGTVARLDLNAAGNTVQRQNLGRTRIWGIQSDVTSRLNEWLTVSGGYLYNQAKVTENAIDPTLVGKFLLQVPTHRGSVQVAYANPRYFNLGVGVQVLGRQFDDEANVGTVPGESKPGLPGFALVDITASRSLSRTVDVFFGVQNLLDKEFVVQLVPTTIGAPRLVHGGVRLRFNGR